MGPRFLTPTTALLLSTLPLAGQPPFMGQTVRRLETPSPCPTGLCLRQGRLWVVDRMTDLLYELDRGTGKVLRTLSAPCWQPFGLAADGDGNLWVGSDMPENVHDQLFRIDPEKGMVTAAIPSPVDLVRALAWDGKALWVGTRKRTLVKVDPQDGSVLATVPSPTERIDAMTWDGRRLWVGEKSKDRIYAVDPATGEVLFPLPAPGPSVSGLAWAEGTLLALDYQDRCVAELAVAGADPVRVGRPRRLRLCSRVILHNQGSGPAPLLTVYVAVPGEDARQRLLGPPRWEPEPAGFERDEWGVPLARFEFRDLKPGATVEARLNAEVELRELLRCIDPTQVQGLEAIPSEIREKYLNDGNKFQLGHPYLKKLVAEAAGGETNPWWIARRLGQAVGSRMSYDLAGGWEPAPVVLERGSGSCSEYTFAFLALCRIAGLPARYVGALVVRGEDGSCDETFHRWAQVWLPPFGWVDWDVQAADAPLKADFAESLCRRGNHYLVTTFGGGPSNRFGWEYNSQVEVTGTGQTQIVVEKYGEWSPLAGPAERQ